MLCLLTPNPHGYRIGLFRKNLYGYDGMTAVIHTPPAAVGGLGFGSAYDGYDGMTAVIHTPSYDGRGVCIYAVMPSWIRFTSLPCVE